MTEEEIVEKDRKYVLHLGKGWGAPVIFVEEEGCIVKDITGKEYIDCLSGCAGTIF
ncbi:MAG: hypothetical protein ACETWO_03090 [Candidatus Hadarchaeaceae archaeon]